MIRKNEYLVNKKGVDAKLNEVSVEMHDSDGTRFMFKCDDIAIDEFGYIICRCGGRSAFDDLKCPVKNPMVLHCGTKTCKVAHTFTVLKDSGEIVIFSQNAVIMLMNDFKEIFV